MVTQDIVKSGENMNRSEESQGVFNDPVFENAVLHPRSEKKFQDCKTRPTTNFATYPELDHMVDQMFTLCSP